MSDKKVVLVTGGTGFAGSHLIEALLPNDSYQVHTTSFSDVPPYMQGILPEENIHKIDLTDFDQTQKLLQELQPDHIYNLASFASAGDSFEKASQVMQNNMTLQLNMLQGLQEAVPKSRMLNIGSADGYGVNLSQEEVPIDESHPLRPVNPYAVSKVSQELLASAYQRSYGLDLVFARPFNHIGERQTINFVVPAFAKQIVKVERGEQQNIQVGNLDAVRDFTDVKDMVEAYILLMNQGKSGEIYNIGKGEGVSIQTVLDKMIELSEKEILVEHDSSKDRPLDIPTVIANNGRIRKLGWHATIPIDVTLNRVLNYWRSQ